MYKPHGHGQTRAKSRVGLFTCGDMKNRTYSMHLICTSIHSLNHYDLTGPIWEKKLVKNLQPITFFLIQS